MTYNTAKERGAGGRILLTHPWSKDSLREYRNFPWEPHDMELHLCPTATAALNRLRAQPDREIAKGAGA